MAVTPVVLCLNRSGEAVAHRIAGALGAQVHGREGRVDKADAFFPNALDHARDLFAAGTPIIGVCAAGILIRAVAPILADKRTEPPVVAVSDDGGVAIPLLGGHRGANRLAREIADLLGAKAAVTTAGDVALGVALDVPPAGYRLANPEDAKSVMAAMLAGKGARIEGDAIFDIASDPRGGVELVVTEAPFAGGPERLVYHPQTYVLGVGCARNAPVEELRSSVEAMLRDAGIAPGAIAAIATLDLKADEPAVNALARAFGVPLKLFTAAELEEMTPRLDILATKHYPEGCAEHRRSRGGLNLYTVFSLHSMLCVTPLATTEHIVAVTWAMAWSRSGAVTVRQALRPWYVRQASQSIPPMPKVA